jgi:hypothetical protein
MREPRHRAGNNTKNCLTFGYCLSSVALEERGSGRGGVRKMTRAVVGKRREECIVLCVL